jgi:hypothetical protein
MEVSDTIAYGPLWPGAKTSSCGPAIECYNLLQWLVYPVSALPNVAK